ncbi:hypothetical protein, partial [Staphylococcus aureus]
MNRYKMTPDTKIRALSVLRAIHKIGVAAPGEKSGDIVNRLFRAFDDEAAPLSRSGLPGVIPPVGPTSLE